MDTDNQKAGEIMYFAQKQVFETDGETHAGKLLVAQDMNKNEIGSTGYIEWNRYDCENDGLNTARMYNVENPNFIINVEKCYRENGVGTGLLEQLLQTVSEDGFNQLLIEGVCFESNGFFDAILEETNLLNTFTKTPRYPGQCAALPVYDYDVRV